MELPARSQAKGFKASELCCDEAMTPPQELIRAAIEIEHWFKERGIKRWELAGICSRNHADALRSLLSEEQL